MRSATNSIKHYDDFNLGEQLYHDDQERHQIKPNREDMLEDTKCLTYTESFQRGIISETDLQTLEIPDMKVIMAPWLKAGNIVMINGSRGIGKTFFCMSLALAITRNISIGPWGTENPVGVLYIDGEMPVSLIKDNHNKLTRHLPALCAPLDIISADWMQKKGLFTPNLASENCRDDIYRLLKDGAYEVVVLDNIASLTPGIDENSKQEWDPINQWLLSIRFLDIAVILIHHTGKSGDQRGTSGREDNIDISIKLSHPPQYTPADGAKFNVDFTKSRGVYGENVKGFTFQISEKDEGLTWTTEDAGNSLRNSIIRMLGEGTQQKDIHGIVKCTKGYVSRVRKKAIEDGYLTENNNFTELGREEFADA